MAHCPNCNRKLHIWNVKAECPDCGVSIPNFEWEKRLEEDAYKREEAFFKMNTLFKRIAYATVGTPLRIARLALSFLPILGYIVPLANLSIEQAGAEALDLKNASVLTLFLNKSVDLKAALSLVSNADSKQAGIFVLASFGVLALSLLLGVIAFFLVPLVNKKPRSPIHAVLHALSIVFYSLTPFMLSKFCTAFADCGLGTATSSVGFGLFIGITLFAVAMIVDIIVVCTPVGEKDNKYIPVEDELQREYGIKAGLIAEDEYPPEKKVKAKKVASN